MDRQNIGNLSVIAMNLKRRGQFVQYLKIGAVRLRTLEFLRSDEGRKQLAEAKRLRNESKGKQ